MKSSTRLDSAIFQLTPTRTRYDLIITANGKTEKIASGLLNPFLAHLKTAQDQIAKGGYSILLQPEPGSGATWFTKGTVEMFVRFVSTPEILERVYTIESEILQIEEAISIQGNSHMGLSTVEDCQAKPVGSSEGSKPMTDGNEEQAIVLYKSDVHPPEANGSIAQEGNSKVQLLKVLETRKTVLQKEQGMAFARAVAAGFDIDHMIPLVSFAECFGASRLIDACLRFIDLWKGKHDTGQWLEIDAAEAMTNRSGFSAMDASGIMPSSVANKQNESRGDSASENNRKEGIDSSADEKRPMDHQVPVGQQQYIQGPFPHPMFPPWPVHSPPGTLPVYQPYPVQGIPYYPNYLGNGPFYQSPYPPMEDSRLNVGHRAGQKRHSMDSIDSNIESEQGDLELEKEASQSRGPWKRAGRPDKKQSGMVVIRNINYVTSKRKNSSGSESQSASDSDTDNEAVDLHKSSLSLKRKGSQAKSMDESNSHDKEETSYGKETDGGHWQAFQNFLLRDADEHNHSAGVFSCKSLFDNLIDKPSVPLFPLHTKIWKAGVPHKVKFFMWSLAHRGVMTNDLFQKRRPSHYLCPQWCVMCKRSLESADHLFLHCSVTIQLWQRLFGLCDVRWVAPRDCTHMLLIQFDGFGGSKRARSLWSCIVHAIFWIIWLERNARIFDGKEADVESLWDRAGFLASFWAFVSPPFRGIPLFLISRDWVAICNS